MKVTFEEQDRDTVRAELIAAGMDASSEQIEKILNEVKLAFKYQLEEEVKYMVENSEELDA